MHPSDVELKSVDVPQVKNWYSRGYLPHLDHPGLIQFITFRLADALPAEVIARLRLCAPDGAHYAEAVQEHLNAGHGECLLRLPAHARIVQDALLHFDGQRYRLLAWVLMPNHVHVLVETQPAHSMSAIVHSWKSFTAKAINQALERQGTLWQREYFDRYIRDERHLQAVIDYIDNNPVKAGLVQLASDWRFGSARLNASQEGAPAPRRQP